MDIQEILKSLLRAKWIIIGVTLLSMVVGFVIKFYGDKKYESEAQLSTGITTNEGIVENRGYVNAYEINLTFNNLVENMKSRLIISQLSYALLLHDLKEENIPFRNLNEVEYLKGVDISALINEIRKRYQNFEVLRPDEPKDQLISNILKELDYDDESISEELLVYRVNSTDYISVVFVSENPNLSAFVVNGLCQEYIRHYKYQYENVTSNSLESLKEIAENKKEIFDQKFEELRNFKAANNLMGGEGSTELVAGQALEYERLIEEEKIKIEGIELSIANINQKLNNKPEQNIDNSALLEIERKIKDLNEAYVLSGSSDTELLDSITRLRELKIIEQNRINRARNVDDDSDELIDRKNELEIELQLARSNLNYLQSRYNSLKSSLNSFSGVETTLSSLEDEVETAREDYQAALKSYNDLKDKSSIYRLKVKQVLYGEPAENPDFTDIITFPVFAAFLSFFLSVSVIIVMELLDNRIKNEEKFQRLTGLNSIQGIPTLKNSKNNLTLMLNNNHKGIDDNLMKSLRKIRFEIESLNKRVFTLTSFKKGEGKSFTIISLAYAISVLNKKVLLIDTNFQSNRLTKNFGVKPMFETLCEELTILSKNNSSVDESSVIDKHYFKEISKNVFILGSRTSSLSPREILSQYNFEFILDKLKENFDYIFLEGAALNEFSDAKELVPYSESIITILSAKSEYKQQDKDSVNYLKGLNSKRGPVILNNI